ncbi:unnamed protein product, partial [marine sediment metagenome]
MKIVFNIGNPWTKDFPVQVRELVDRTNSDAEVEYLYGNTSIIGMPNAREDDRIPSRDFLTTKRYIENAHENGLKINWTMNGSVIGNVKNVLQDWKARGHSIVAMLEDLGIDMLTVAHPLLMLMLRDYGCTIPIEISTIANVCEPAQLRWFIDQEIQVNKICLPVGKNRNTKYLMAMMAECNKLGITPELIANEFCFLNGCNCEGLLRRTCYDMNALALSGDS